MKTQEQIPRRSSFFAPALTVFVGVLVGGTLLLLLWQQLTAFIFIVWGTGGRAISMAFHFSISSFPNLAMSYLVFSFPLLVAGALVHCITLVVWKKSILTLCVALALLCSVPVVWSLFRLIPAGHVAGAPGNLAIFTWVTLGVLKWIVVWVLTWYFTNTLGRMRTQ